MFVFSLSVGSERLQKGEASDEDEDTEYFDAMEDSPAFITVTATENTQHRSVSPYGLYSTLNGWPLSAFHIHLNGSWQFSLVLVEYKTDSV